MNSIYLLTTDIRFHDNRTFSECLKNSKSVGFVYCKPKEISKHRWNFIYESLTDFSNKLKSSGHDLHLVDSTKEVDNLPNVDFIYHSKTYLEHLSFNTPVKTFENHTLYDVDQLPTSVFELQKVFTSFRKKIEKNKIKVTPPLQAVTAKALKAIDSLKLDFRKFNEVQKPAPTDTYFEGGETKALKRLEEYFLKPQLAKTYKETRNGMVNFDDSTKFSPWLAQGCVSPKRVYSALKNFEDTHGANDSTYWIWFELLWRDFFKFTCLKHGQDLKSLTGIQDEYKIKHKGAIAFKIFEDWKNGQTGQDFIDANMLELLNHGWMSNRGRQNVASFLCHHLGLDWRWGAQWFEHQLVDYDAESNWGNWSYQAGVGNDPRNRVFNPVKQAENYDPDCTYRNKFLN